MVWGIYDWTLSSLMLTLALKMMSLQMLKLFVVFNLGHFDQNFILSHKLINY